MIYQQTAITPLTSCLTPGVQFISSSNLSILRRTLSIARPLLLPLLRFENP